MGREKQVNTHSVTGRISFVFEQVVRIITANCV
jgi:hypothetical protein